MPNPALATNQPAIGPKATTPALTKTSEGSFNQKKRVPAEQPMSMMTTPVHAAGEEP
jgi:hypothetical protein